MDRQGMNPFLRLFPLIIASAAVFIFKRKYVGGGDTSDQIPPTPMKNTPFDSTPMPMNRPKMKRPSLIPTTQGIPGMEPINNSKIDENTTTEEAGSKIWLELRGNEGLVVNAEGNNLFAEMTDPVNLVACMGKLGTGKSYLLNSLSEKPFMFGVSAGIDSFTKGIHVSPNFEVQTSIPKFAYLDMEGQSSSGTSYDIKLAAPVLLVSKVILFVVHCPIRPSAEDGLKPLPFMKAAKFVNKPIDRRNLFGNLHVVLLGCPHEASDCNKIIFSTEDPYDANSNEAAKGMEVRNDIRKAIQESFESDAQVWCLPQLKEAPANYRDAEQPYIDKIDEIRRAFKYQLAKPKLLGGRPLTGRMISELMSLLKKPLNSDNPSLNPPGLIDGILQAECKRITESLFREAELKLKALEGELPITDSNKFRSRIKELKESIYSELEDQLLWIISGGAQRQQKAQQKVQGDN